MTARPAGAEITAVSRCEPTISPVCAWGSLGPGPPEVKVVENGGNEYTINLRAGEEGEMVLKFPARDRLSLVIRPQRIHRPEVDRRQLGVALRSLTFGTEDDEISADLSHDLKDLLTHGSEDTVFNLLWSTALTRRESYSRHQARVVGPGPGRCAKPPGGRAGRFDAVVSFMLPMPTLGHGGPGRGEGRRALYARGPAPSARSLSLLARLHTSASRLSRG